jgi:hypothetical protein
MKLARFQPMGRKKWEIYFIYEVLFEFLNTVNPEPEYVA